MRGLGNLIDGVQPSAVALQSGVLVLFVVAFLIVVVNLAGKHRAKECDEIGKRSLED